jgi:hypothetical protein
LAAGLGQVRDFIGCSVVKAAWPPGAGKWPSRKSLAAQAIQGRPGHRATVGHGHLPAPPDTRTPAAGEGSNRHMVGPSLFVGTLLCGKGGARKGQVQSCCPRGREGCVGPRGLRTPVNRIAEQRAMYSQFMIELSRFMLDSGIAMSADFRGCTRAEISALEDRLAVRLPEAFTEYLCAMGHGCGILMGGDEYGIAAIDVAQRVASRITTNPDCPWRPSQRMLPFRQHHGCTFLFFHTDEGNDPPIWAYLETEAGPKDWAPSFTCWLRECAIDCIEGKPWNDEVCREISLHRDDWLERKAVLDRYDDEAGRIRRALCERVAALDRGRGRVASPREFQEIWNREFRESDLYRTLVEEDKRIPWGWVDPSDA